MFSSLEVLNAEDTLNAAPVARQGAFQPKAKPRVRKGVAAPTRKPSSLSSSPAPKTISVPSLTPDNPAEDIHQPENQTIDVDFTVNGSYEEAETAGEPVLTFESCQQNSPGLSAVAEKAVNNEPVSVSPEISNKVGFETGPVNNADLTETRPIHHADLAAAAFAATTSASASQPAAEAANEADGAKESAEEALVGNAVETVNRKKRNRNQAEQQQDIEENVSSHTAIPKRKRKKPVRFADSIDDDEPNITKAGTQGASEPAKNIRRGENQANKRQENAKNDFSTTIVPNSPKEITKVKISKLTSVRATAAATTSQPAAEVADEPNGASKSVPPAAEKGQEKKFKKCIQSRRKVERRAMNPVDLDLDPKKMTMKDIIRLAEAKEKMLKKGNTKKASDRNELTANVPDKEHERTCLAPQVQIVDGRIVINQESLTVSAHPKDDIRMYKRVEETHAKLNYHSYMKRTPKQLWQKHETELFYQALREFGTNFAMIQHLFPGRTRKQVLLKYKKEEKLCPLRVSEAMRLKPCETSHFMEILSSMNLLPSEMSVELENEHGSVPFDTTCSREDVEDTNCVVAGVERCTTAGDGCASKLEESPTRSKSWEDHENNGSNPCGSQAFTLGKPDENQQLHNQEPPKPDETTKPCDSPKTASTPPRKKKTLFSYQTSTSKS